MKINPPVLNWSRFKKNTPKAPLSNSDKCSALSQGNEVTKTIYIYIGIVLRALGSQLLEKALV